MALIVLTLIFSFSASSEEIVEVDFFEDEIELELEENFDFSDEIYPKDADINDDKNSVDNGNSILDLVQSSITVGSFNSQIFNTRESKSAFIINLSSSSEIPSVGFVDVSANVSIDTEKRNLTNEITHFTIQNSIKNIKWKIGKFRKSWGDVEGSLALNTINPADSLLNQPLPGMDQSSRWLAEISFFTGKSTSDFFISLNRDTVHAVNSNSNNSGSEFGLKSSFDIEKGQVSFYLASLFPRMGTVDINSGLSHSNRYNLIGVSAHKDVNHYLLKFDLAKKVNLNKSTFSNLRKGSRIDGALGVEYAPSYYDKWFFKLEGSMWEDSIKSYYITGSSDLLAEESKSSSYSFAYSRNTSNDKLINTISFGGNGNGNSFYLAGETTYSISDHTKVKANFLLFEAKPDDLAYEYDKSRLINFGWTRYF